MAGVGWRRCKEGKFRLWQVLDDEYEMRIKVCGPRSKERFCTTDTAAEKPLELPEKRATGVPKTGCEKQTAAAPAFHSRPHPQQA